MRKIIKVDNKVTILLDNGNFIEREVTDEEFIAISKARSDDDVLRIVCPEYKKVIVEKDKALSLVDKVKKSKILKLSKNTIYWNEVSGLSVPQELAEAVIKAEKENDKLKLTTYKNFWTLMSLNTDEECRKNLYWFLQLHGLKLAKCGFFVAYRNVDVTDTPNVYTDRHSHSTRIEIGNMVTLDRKECDCNSKVECSRGLHCASVKWLKKNYFGSIGLACLVNPADVVAVPHSSEYGKVRTCAYLPMKIIEYDKDNNVIPLDVEDGFDCSYVTKVLYEGIMGTEEDSAYKIKIPQIKALVKESIQDQLLEIAKECIINREL